MAKDKFILEAAKAAACRELFIKYGGLKHHLIEKEMRELGFADFSRRILYKRSSGRGRRPGWIAEFGWKKAVAELQEVAASNSPPYKGGVAAASADGVVLSRPAPKNHPAAEAALLCKEGSQIAPLPRKDASFEDFQAWLRRVSPNMTWHWRHQLYLYERLKRVTEGTCKRLMIFMPPRHGKSELVTVRYTAWRLRRKPSMNVILASYGQRLANKFSRAIRRVLCDDEAIAGCGVAELRKVTELKEGSKRPPNSETVPNSSTICSSATPQLPTRMFPFTSSKPVNSIAEWGTAAGGGLRAVGVGSGVTGFGADLIVIDDPVKNRAQAESETYRERVWDWYSDDIYTRLEPEGSIVLIQTRWHEDDLAGRLLKQMDEGGEQWEIVDLPAIAEFREVAEVEISRGISDIQVRPSLKGTKIIAQGKAEGCDPGIDVAIALDPEGVEPAAPVDPLQGADDLPSFPGVPPKRLHPGLLSSSPSATSILGTPSSRLDESIENSETCRNPATTQLPPDWRVAGEALCPERYDTVKLAEIRSQLGTYSFSALYQQRPTPAEGAIFKREWLKNIVEYAPPGLKWFRGYDLAISTRTTADYTASFRVAVDKDGNMYIADGFRARLEYPEQRRYIIERIRTEADTIHGIEDSVHAKALVQELRREARLTSRSFRLVRVTSDKVTRALSWSPRAEEGKLRLVRGPWIDEFIAELVSFPGSTHDDQADAVSVAVILMSGGPDRKAYSFK